MIPKKKGLTIGILMGSAGKAKRMDEESFGSTDKEESIGDDTEEDELPPGLLEAVTEFRAAETDEEAAHALRRALICCEEC